ncbi:MAG: glycine cleavage system protein GcvH [Planctomycetota bacterium]
MVEIPADRRYAASHEWASKADGLIVVGITDFAAQELGDLVFIDLPEVGSEVIGGERFGEIESVKAVSELSAPVSGKVIEVNQDIEENLETISQSPYEDGWMIKIEPSDATEFDDLLKGADYERQLESDE